MKYCVGYIFDENLEKVWLIRKRKPEWQAGKLNGIGGKVEEGESFLECMTREAAEEAGYEGDWVQFAERQYYSGAHVAYFWSIANSQKDKPVTCESEEIECWSLIELLGSREEVVPEDFADFAGLILGAIQNISSFHFDLSTKEAAS